MRKKYKELSVEQLRRVCDTDILRFISTAEKVQAFNKTEHKHYERSTTVPHAFGGSPVDEYPP